MTTTAIDRPTEQQLASEERLARHNLAKKVHYATGNGDALVNSLMGFVNGDIPDAKACHIHAANVELAVMGGYLPEDFPGAASRIHRAATTAATATAHADDAHDDEQPQRKPIKPKATLKQILNKPIGRYIREETDEGFILIDFLAEIMEAPPNPVPFSTEQIPPSDRLAAAKELLRRGYGSRNPYHYYSASSSSFEDKALNSKIAAYSRDCANGIKLARFLLEVVGTPRLSAKKTYTFAERVWAAKYLLYLGFDIPWEHVTPEAIDAYIHEHDARERVEAERRAQEAAERKANADKLTPDQEASVMEMFAEMQRATDAADAKSAEIAKQAAADADVAPDTDADKDNGKDTDAEDTDEDTRGATAVANALQNHPEVDLDTALANFPETANVPKEALTHDLIYRAIIAEANYQKRQQKFKNLPPTDGPADGDPPTARSP